MPATPILVALVCLLQLVKPEVSGDCKTWRSPKEDVSFVACRRSSVTSAFIQTGREQAPVRDEARVLRDANIFLAAWSPSARLIALDAGVYEASTVLLINVETRDVVDVSLLLTGVGVEPEGPVWDRSGEWLIFHTTGAGESLRNDGVYALRIADSSIHRIFLGQVQRVSLTDDSLTIEGRDDRSQSYSFAEMLSKAVIVEGHPKRAMRTKG